MNIYKILYASKQYGIIPNSRQRIFWWLSYSKWPKNKEIIFYHQGIIKYKQKHKNNFAAQNEMDYS